MCLFEVISYTCFSLSKSHCLMFSVRWYCWHVAELFSDYWSGPPQQLYFLRWLLRKIQYLPLFWGSQVCADTMPKTKHAVVISEKQFFLPCKVITAFLTNLDPILLQSKKECIRGKHFRQLLLFNLFRRENSYLRVPRNNQKNCRDAKTCFLNYSRLW